MATREGSRLEGDDQVDSTLPHATDDPCTSESADVPVVQFSLVDRPLEEDDHVDGILPSATDNPCTAESGETAADFLEVKLSRLEQSLEGDYVLKVSLRNISDEPCHSRRIILATTSTSYLEPASVEIGEIASYSDVHRDLHLVQRSKATSSDMPRLITLDIQNEDLDIMQHVENELDVSAFKGRLVELSKRADGIPYNIVLLGPLNSAKSSFINGVCTMLSHAVKMVAAVGGGADCTTTQILRYDLSKTVDLNIRLFDTFGITRDSYTRGVSLPNLISGRVPVNASKYNSADSLVKPGRVQLPSRSGERPRNRHRMHSAIVFVSAEFLTEPDHPRREEDQQAIDTAIRETTAQNLNPILVLAKADLISQEDVDGKCLYLSQLFGIPRSSIFPFESYILYNILDYRKDHMAYCILEEAVLRAKELRDHAEEVADE